MPRVSSNNQTMRVCVLTTVRKSSCLMLSLLHVAGMYTSVMIVMIAAPLPAMTFATVDAAATANDQMRMQLRRRSIAIVFAPSTGICYWTSRCRQRRSAKGSACRSRLHFTVSAALTIMICLLLLS